MVITKLWLSESFQVYSCCIIREEGRVQARRANLIDIPINCSLSWDQTQVLSSAAVAKMNYWKLNFDALSNRFPCEIYAFNSFLNQLLYLHLIHMTTCPFL